MQVQQLLDQAVTSHLPIVARRTTTVQLMTTLQPGVTAAITVANCPVLGGTAILLLVMIQVRVTYSGESNIICRIILASLIIFALLHNQAYSVIFLTFGDTFFRFLTGFIKISLNCCII